MISEVALSKSLVLLISCSSIGAALCYLISVLGRKYGWYSKESFRRPIGEAVPLLGGVGIVVAAAITNIFASDLVVWKILFAATPMVIVGIYDDLRESSARLKFGAQILSSLVWVAFVSPHEVVFTRLGLPPVLGVLVTILFLITLASAINFLDGIDGQAAILAMVAFSALGFAYDPLLPGAVLFVSATLGFLFLNFPPAKIYMGEVGSSFLGFSAGALATLLPIKTSAFSTFMAINFIFSLAFTDLLYVFARRLYKGLQPWSPDKEHFHHKLKSIGLSVRSALFVTSFIVTISCLTGYRMLVSKNNIEVWMLATISGLSLTFIYFGVQLAEKMWGKRISVFGRQLIEKYVPLDLVKIKVEDEYRCVLIDILPYFTEIQSRGIAAVDRFAHDFGIWASSLEDVKSVKLVGSYSVAIVLHVKKEKLLSWKSAILTELHRIFIAHRALRTHKINDKSVYFYDNLYDHEIQRILQLEVDAEIDIPRRITG